MEEIEKEIKDYLDNFFTSNELINLSTNINPQKHNFDDTTINDSQYINICKVLFDKLKNASLLDKYRIEVGPNCTYLIEQLFKTYVDKDTFVVISSHEHNAVQKQINTENKYIINVQSKTKLLNDYNFIIQDLITKFKKSNCTKIFCIMVGTTPQTAITIDQSFFVKLKNSFLKQNIPHLMFLDDCQGIFMIERNYEIFDGFLGTTHVLFPLFDSMGLLFTKLPEKIGFIQKGSLITLNNKLDILLKNKDKAKQFNILLSKYFQKAFNETGFSKYENEATHQFAIHLDKAKSNVELDSELIKYGIKFNPIESIDNFVRIRYQEVIIQSSDNFILGLRKLNKALYKLQKYKDFGMDIVYSNKPRFKDIQFASDQIILNPVIENSLGSKAKEIVYNRFFSDFIKTRTK